MTDSAHVFNLHVFITNRPWFCSGTRSFQTKRSVLQWCLRSLCPSLPVSHKLSRSLPHRLKFGEKSINGNRLWSRPIPLSPYRGSRNEALVCCTGQCILFSAQGICYNEVGTVQTQQWPHPCQTTAGYRRACVSRQISVRWINRYFREEIVLYHFNYKLHNYNLICKLSYPFRLDPFRFQNSNGTERLSAGEGGK